VKAITSLLIQSFTSSMHLDRLDHTPVKGVGRIDDPAQATGVAQYETRAGSAVRGQDVFGGHLLYAQELARIQSSTSAGALNHIAAAV